MNLVGAGRRTELHLVEEVALAEHQVLELVAAERASDRRARREHRGEPEQLLGRGVDRTDLPGRVREDDRVGNALDDRAELRFLGLGECVQLGRADRAGALLPERLEYVTALLDQTFGPGDHDETLGPARAAQADRNEALALAHVDQAEGRFVDGGARLGPLGEEPDHRLVETPEDASREGAAVGVEQADEALLLGREPRGSVEDEVHERFDVERSEEAVVRFVQGREVGRTTLGLLVELRPVDQGGRLVGEHLREAPVIVRERGPGLGDREVEDADRPVVHPERRDDAGRDLALLRNEVDERFLIDVAEEEGLPGGDDATGDAVPTRHAVAERNGRGLAGGGHEDELAAAVVQEHDRGLLGPEQVDGRGHDRLDRIRQSRSGRGDLAHLQGGLEGPLQLRRIPEVGLLGTRE